MEWEAPAIVLETVLYGEGDFLVTLLTGEYGAWRALVRGGASRSKVATWQVGNLLAARWAARLPEQLGFFTAELVHPGAALAMDNRLSLAVLNAACATATGALPEREAQPTCFAGLARILAGIAIENAALPALIVWELELLRSLGFGLDLSSCALSGATSGLAFVSPKTGRAVAEAAAGIWRERLLPLPAFLVDEGPADMAACRDGLHLTGYFLARDAFGQRHRPLPQSRLLLYELVSDLSQRP